MKSNTPTFRFGFKFHKTNTNMLNYISKFRTTELRFMLLGQTGSGKSTVINYLTNYFLGEREFKRIIEDRICIKIAIPVLNWENNVIKQFKHISTKSNINDETQSQTSECGEYDFNFKDYSNSISYKLSFIDTPGLNDTNGCEHDVKNLKKIFNAATKYKTLNGIILFINGTMPRLSTSMLNVFSSIKSFLPNSIIENLIVVFTNCDKNSCNFDINCLKDISSKFESFTMQNSLFRWNGEELKKQTSS